MRWMSRWPAKIPRHNSNADDNIIDIEALLAQAEAIKDNPDEFLPVEVELEAAA